MTSLDDSGTGRGTGVAWCRARLPQLVAAQQGGTATGGAPPLADRLGAWLGWAEAITLAGVVQGGSPEVPVRPGRIPSARAAADGEVQRLQQRLAARLAEAQRALVEALAALDLPASGEVASVCRRHLLLLLRDSEDAIGALRARLRATAATLSPALARLALLDAALDKALATRERSLLEGAVAAFEGGWARQVGAVGRDGRARAEAESAVAAAWTTVARAALELRQQPVLGWADALAEAASSSPEATAPTLPPA